MDKNCNEFSYLDNQNCEYDPLKDHTPTEFYKPSCNQGEYIDMRKVLDPCDNQSYEIEEKIEEYIKKGFMSIYTSSTGAVCARSGMGAELIYGMLQIDKEPYYFVIVDDPGASGYDCCGFYRVYYSRNLSKFLEEQAYTRKERELLKILYEKN